MSSYRARVLECDEFLKRDELSLAEARRFAFEGIPDEGSRRSILWKLLLFYLPSKRSDWGAMLARQRATYRQFVDEIIINPQAQENSADHPLSLDPDSQWGKFFEDNSILLQIDKDCRRLLPDISFMQQASRYPVKMAGSSLRTRVEKSVLEAKQVATNRSGTKNISLVQRSSSSDEYHVLPEGQEAHWEVVERILFIYAKLNPGVSYVQGMNEIVGPLYYVFASDSDLKWQEHAEADTFFCFTNLMSEIRDNFIKTLDDDAACGIGAMMITLMAYLKRADASLSAAMDAKQLKPQFFSFRWLTLLLSQEFDLPDVIRLWDTLFSDSKRFEFLIFFCCAMLICIRDDLLKGDFATCVKLLQNYPPTEIHSILEKAVELRRLFSSD
ncbi:TBC1 domain family member 13-like [Oscarella lobularis]|uniref:TBC1 domain family member 13-like n=1 Tax=Oscarella lobularis TaxID=121494 RepID=UPI003314270B